MYKIIDNKYNIKDSDVFEVVRRVKALIINSNNEILLGYSNNIYQFPGGHVENETLLNALNREIKEETGINLKVNCKPIICAYRYYKDYPSVNKNRLNEIYYFEIKTNKLPDLDNTNYTSEEKDGNFELRYISLANAIREISNNSKIYGDKKGIASEMIEVLNVYLNNKY